MGKRSRTGVKGLTRMMSRGAGGTAAVTVASAAENIAGDGAVPPAAGTCST